MGIINVITIAREYGSGSGTVGHMIADKLGFRYIDKEILKLLQMKAGLMRNCLQRLMRKLNLAF